jgi:hypothetical protein|tara:strand:+ start:427 stop:699 length:273 start_codon:yes stop_codon:yes gene_type:complete
MDQNKLASEVSRGEKAKLLLDEPIIKEAFETLKKEFQEAILNTKHGEDAARTTLWQAYHLTDKVENHLRTVMETGKLAAQQINQLKKNSA